MTANARNAAPSALGPHGQPIGEAMPDWQGATPLPDAPLTGRRVRVEPLDAGRNRDTAWFSILDGEWPALEAILRRWLSPDNFDAQGRQRLSLSALTAGSSASG
ncbi:hypothetical protein [Halomonas stenophila]|uniref:Uncharacterized protein n=1 Tax=Halomonas stenophila TaxID=795312 RepID=A0A7W5ES01_9GAMM|nr:hypothetical protein [Halomonas stenophila]MBB3230211.1 hypothetical protein [Halomonas stenophila]